MAVESGGFNYSGVPLELFLAGSITFGHGGDPSYADLLYAPYPNPPLTGTLTIFDGTQVISLPDCRTQDMQFDVDGEGFTRMRLVVEDRRWKWRHGWITGTYNIPDPQAIKPRREKKPSELLRLLMEAMGEPSFVAIGVPNDVRPFVEWDGPPLDAALALCEELGLRLFLDYTTNQATIRPLNDGAKLPSNNRLISPSIGVKPPLVPSTMRFLGSPMEWQYDLELEPVMEETDGSYVAMNDVSYKPKDGWEVEPIGSHEDGYSSACPNVDVKQRELAKKCLWRCFRVSVPIQKSKLKEGEDRIDELERILPLHDRQVHVAVLEPNTPPQPLPPQLFGKFDCGQDLAAEKPAKEVNSPYGKLPLWEKGWTLDVSRGLAWTNEPCFRRQKATDHASTQVDPGDYPHYVAPKLYLRTAISVRNKDTMAFLRSTFDMSPSGQKYPGVPYVVARDDLALVYAWNPKTKAWEDNKKDFEEQAEFYLKQELRAFQVVDQATGVYAGMVVMPLDGAVHQVTYTVDDAGFMTTTISRSREDVLIRQTYAERRRQDVLREVLREKKRGPTRRKGNR